VIEIRPVTTDADHESWRQVRIAVVPNERTQSVAEMRAAANPERLLVLAEIDGALAGSGLADRSHLPGAAHVMPRVLPGFRRRGVGTALLRALEGHAAGLGVPIASSEVTDPGSLAFAERFGFAEVDRQVEQVRRIGDEPAPAVPAGVEIVPVARRPDLWRVAYEAVGRQAFADMATIAPPEVSLAEWEREWIGDPEATFLALAGGEVIGCAGLLVDGDHAGRAEHGLTAVRREWRGRGVAAALKRATLAWATANGLREVYTWTQRGNADMRRLNEHMGYETRTISISVRAPLPLNLP
jgi:GNAT superfamily N-acetyltransferase